MRTLAEECKKRDNAQLVVFPEAFIGGVSTVFQSTGHATESVHRGLTDLTMS